MAVSVDSEKIDLYCSPNTPRSKRALSSVRRVKTRSLSFKNLLSWISQGKPLSERSLDPPAEGKVFEFRTRSATLGADVLMSTLVTEPADQTLPAANKEIAVLGLEPNQGAKWERDVRRAQIKRRATTPDLKADSRWRGPLEVLVVDDSRVARLILHRNLGMAGHVTTGVASAEEALLLLEERTRNTEPFPDAILIDLSLPGGMSGMELVQDIRSRYPQLETPLIAHTTSEDWEDGGFCLSTYLVDAGFTDYTFKGARSEGLLGLLKMQVQYSRKENRKEAPM